jgi:hypothetical protein
MMTTPITQPAVSDEARSRKYMRSARLTGSLALGQAVAMIMTTREQVGAEPRSLPIMMKAAGGGQPPTGFALAGLALK